MVLPCFLSICFFCPFSILITLLGEKGAGRCAFCLWLFLDFSVYLFDAMSFAWQTVVQLVDSFNSGLLWGISQEYSFLFRHSDRFDFVFLLRYTD